MPSPEEKCEGFAYDIFETHGPLRRSGYTHVSMQRGAAACGVVGVFFFRVQTGGTPTDMF